MRSRLRTEQVRETDRGGGSAHTQVGRGLLARMGSQASHRERVPKGWWWFRKGKCMSKSRKRQVSQPGVQNNGVDSTRRISPSASGTQGPDVGFRGDAAPQSWKSE